ncbi:cytidine deaminase [Porphyromonas sp. oral taxon 278 str. W7784]|uniref:cytidine deaminase n=1 Tax=Porphyromonas sp. oral taxon 278 TaxID=712437 RepID=UPI0003AD11F1|nr:cytidine deaminase [Porphyromonas sp. oral taxon 278]ERJ69879.1 cytidine deaminase [Porphyromonas sp. oral taxon 278 str. W7784]
MEQTFTIPYKTLLRSELTPEDRRLEELAVEAAQKAYAPYSHFHVGAAVLLANGEIITGSNQENAAYPSGTCAERTALFWAGAQCPDVPVEKLLIVAFNASGRVPFISPCGGCRQVIMEAATRFHPFPILLAGDEKTVVLEDCRYLLPFGFDGSSL